MHEKEGIPLQDETFTFTAILLDGPNAWHRG